MELFHYFDRAAGPFRNLSDLSLTEAISLQKALKQQNKGLAGKRSDDYVTIRFELEDKARAIFAAKGGKPIRQRPHYMTFGACPWLLEWYREGQELSIPLDRFHPETVSFTYGDLFPTMRYQDGKPYRNQVYTLLEIQEIVKRYGLPQLWNSRGDLGPERYIEAQIWDERPLQAFLAHA